MTTINPNIGGGSEISRPAPIQPFDPPKPIPPFPDPEPQPMPWEPDVIPDIPGIPDIDPNLPFFDSVELTELTDQTVNALKDASVLDRDDIIENYKLDLNSTEIDQFPDGPDSWKWRSQQFNLGFKFSISDLESELGRVQERISLLNTMARGPEQEKEHEALLQVQNAIHDVIHNRPQLPNPFDPFLKI